MKPITPKEAGLKKVTAFEPEIIQAVNELIVQKLDSYGTATVHQKDIIAKYFQLKNVEATEAARKILFDSHQLDIESTYKKAGWNVGYHKSSYGESWFEPYFKFEKKVTR